MTDDIERETDGTQPTSIGDVQRTSLMATVFQHPLAVNPGWYQQIDDEERAIMERISDPYIAASDGPTMIVEVEASLADLARAADMIAAVRSALVVDPDADRAATKALAGRVTGEAVKLPIAGSK